MSEHDEPRTGYREEVVGAPTGSAKEIADAQIALAKHRQGTYEALLFDLNDRLKCERLQNAHLEQLLLDERAESQKILAEQRKWIGEELQRRREDAQKALHVVDEAVQLAHQNIERAKLTAHVLNTPPPPRTTAAEELNKFGMHVVTELSQLMGIVFAGDQAAQERIKKLGHKLLSLGEEKPADAPALGAAPAAPPSAAAQTAVSPAPAAAPPPPAAPAPAAASPAGAAPPQATAAPAESAPSSRREPTAYEFVQIARRLAEVPADRIDRYCAKKGIRPEALSVPEVLALAAEEPPEVPPNGG